MMNLSKSIFSWSLFVEGFYMDAAYNTSPFISDGSGRVDYEDGTRSIYDFVDDNDDQDKKPDQKRRYQDPRTGEEFRASRTGRSAEGFADEAVFPGWDQNNDFISDFNQNSNIFSENRFPDYEEPFLRYGSDRLNTSSVLISTTTAGSTSSKTTTCPIIPTKGTARATTCTCAIR